MSRRRPRDPGFGGGGRTRERRGRQHVVAAGGHRTDAQRAGPGRHRDGVIEEIVGNGYLTPLPPSVWSPGPLQAEQIDDTSSASENVIRTSSVVGVTTRLALTSVTAVGAGLVRSMVNVAEAVPVFPAVSVATARTV
jgi:hypothetical protein